MITRPDPVAMSMRFQVQSREVTVEQLRDLLRGKLQDAIRWILVAAQGGITPAQVVLGQLLLDGKGIVCDRAAAFGWFLKAADAGDVEGANMVGRCYEQGWGVAVDFSIATRYFAIAAQAGHLWGKVNLAQMLMRMGDQRDFSRCLVLFRQVAESGTGKARLKAMNSLARFLEEGWAGPVDRAGAAFWYLKAASLGDHWAQYNLATILYRQGNGAEAGRWLENAIRISDNGFRRRIASALLEQDGPELRRHGLDALSHCAEGGAPKDLFAYGCALADGPPGLCNPGEARKLFMAAAGQGHSAAAVRLRYERALKSPFRNSIWWVFRRRGA